MEDDLSLDLQLAMARDLAEETLKHPCTFHDVQFVFHFYLEFHLLHNFSVNSTGMITISDDYDIIPSSRSTTPVSYTHLTLPTKA